MQIYVIYNVCIYIRGVKVNALTQIKFNGTNFINARLTQRAFSVWPVAQPVVGEMEMRSVANLLTLQTPLANFFPSKSAQTLFSFWELPVAYCRARSCSPSARTPLALSLGASALFSAWQRGLALSVKHRYYVASLILHASIAEITAQLLSLSYVYLISSDDGSIIRIFVQINILERRYFYAILMGRVSVTISYSSRCLTTETEKKYQWKVLLRI